jgi:hypothetical protein
MTCIQTTHPFTRYTPGPWDYDMDYIVAPDPDGRHPDIYIAEIAAAPELLEALDYLLEQTQ